MHYYSKKVYFFFIVCITIPYLALLALHIAWTNITLAKDLETERDSTDKGLQIALTVLCIWFLVIEFAKFRKRGVLFYFFQLWNIINLLPMILILVNVFWHDKNPEETWNDAKG